MIKIAIVRAVERDDHHGYWAAFRHFPSARPTVLEVLDQDEDPPAKEGEETVTVPASSFYQDGAQYKAARFRVGKKALWMIREQKGFLSVEERLVEKMSDVSVDDKSNAVKVQGDKDPMAVLLEKAAASDDMAKEIERLKKRLSEFEEMTAPKPAPKK